jgi:hypothetical protein
MRVAGLMAAFAAVAMLAACETADPYYDTRASSASDPLGSLLGGIFGGGSGSSIGRGNSRVYDEEMDRLEAEQRRIDRERAAIDRRYGRSRY